MRYELQFFKLINAFLGMAVNRACAPKMRLKDVVHARFSRVILWSCMLSYIMFGYFLVWTVNVTVRKMCLQLSQIFQF